jgi:hypothetical protein
MRKKRYAVAVTTIIIAALAVFVWQKIRASDEEGPIIVRNGSIEIETIDGEWKDGNNEWINQTSGTINSNDLWIKVTSSTGTCRAMGKPVHIQYSEPSVNVTFTTSGMWWFAKTRVSPKSAITLVDGKHLRAGTAGGGGHITEVRAQNLTCSLSPDSQNVRIAICSSSKVTDCQ